MNFTIWVSRRLWPWPKRYRCKGVQWGVYNDAPDGRIELLNSDVLRLTLPDERSVYVDVRGRTITYGRDFYEMKLAEMEQEAGQKIPVRGS